MNGTYGYAGRYQQKLISTSSATSVCCVVIVCLVKFLLDFKLNWLFPNHIEMILNSIFQSIHILGLVPREFSSSAGFISPQHHLHSTRPTGHLKVQHLKQGSDTGATHPVCHARTTALGPLPGSSWKWLLPIEGLQGLSLFPGANYFGSGGWNMGIEYVFFVRSFSCLFARSGFW